MFRFSFGKASQQLANSASPNEEGKGESVVSTPNPLFANNSAMDDELRRAAAPSVGSRVGSSQVKMVSPEEELRRAASPSTPRVSNPIVSMELTQASRGVQSDPPPLELLDPEMQKSSLTDQPSLQQGGRKQELYNKFVLAPAGAIKHKTWSSPRRRICTMITLLVIFIIVVYLIAKLVDTLKILDAEPSVAGFSMGSLCNRMMEASLTMNVMNPSGTSATLKAMQCKVFFKQDYNTSLFLGQVFTQDIVVGPGLNVLKIDLKVDVHKNESHALQKVLKQYLEGSNATLILQLPLTASFSPDVFIFPVSISYDYVYEFTLPSFSNATAAEEESEDDESSMLQDVILLQASNPESYVKAEIGIQIWNETTPSMYTFAIPPLNFDLYLNNLLTATGRSQDIVYGNPLVEQMIRIQAAVGDEHTLGVHYILNKLFYSPIESLIPIKVRVKDQSSYHSEFPNNTASVCYIETLLEGLEVGLEFTTPSSTETAAPSSSPPVSASSLFQLSFVEFMSLDALRTMTMRISLDLLGLMTTFYNVRGIFPKFDIQMDVINSTNISNSFGLVHLPQSFGYNYTHPVVNGLSFEVSLSSATLLIESVERLVVHNLPVFASIHLSGNTIASRLLSPIHVDNPPRQREGGYGIQLNVTSDNNFILGDVGITGLDTAFFGGTRLVFHPLKFDLKLGNDKGGFHVKPVLSLLTNGYDTSVLNAELKVRLDVGDQYGGKVLQAMITNMTDYKRMHFSGSFTYRGVGPFGDDFYYKRVNVTAPLSQTPSSIGNGVGTSFFQLYHAELLSLVDNEVSSKLFWGLDLTGIVLDVSLPQIALAINRCNKEAHMASIVLDAIKFSTRQRDSEATLRVKLDSTEKLMDVANVWSLGTDQKICLGGHPTFGMNFLSYLVGNLAVGLTLPGKPPTNSTGASQEAPLSTQMVEFIRVASDNATHACMSTELNLYDPNSTFALSLGWGNAHMLINNAASARVMELKLQGGWFGPVDPYRVATYQAPLNPGSTQIELCFGSNSLAVRTVFQNLYDGLLPVTLIASGTWASRSGLEGASPMSLQVDFPRTSYATLLSVVSSSPTDQLGDLVDSPSFLEFEQLDLISLNVNLLMLHLGLTMQENAFGFQLTLPEIHLRVGEIVGANTESAWFDIGVRNLPSFGTEPNRVILSQIPVNITLIGSAVNDWGASIPFVQRVLDQQVDLSVGSSVVPNTNLLSNIIPSIKIPFKRVGTKSPTVPPSLRSANYLDLDLSIDSNMHSASVMANFTLLERLPFKLVWPTVSIQVSSLGRGAIGSLFVPGVVLQEVHSGARFVNATLQNAAPVFLKQLFMNATLAVEYISFSGRMGTQPMSALFKIPSFSSNNEDLVSEDSLTSQVRLMDVALLGAGNIGENGTLPCLFNTLCVVNMIRNDSQLEYAGVTAGITLEYLALPQFSGITWRVSLLADASVFFGANGYDFGRIVLRPPLTVSHVDTEFALILTLIPNPTRMTELRDTISSILEGYDTVFSVGGTDTNNFLSKLMHAVEQDIAFVNIPPPPANASSLLQTMKLGLVSSTRQRVVLRVDQDIVFDDEFLKISVGNIRAEVFFGHTKTCNGNNWCLNGVAIASAETFGFLTISPSALTQTLSLQAAMFHANSQAQAIADDLISRYVWSLEMPMEIRIYIQPTAQTTAKFRQPGPFELRTFLTIPAGLSLSGFIDSITVDVAGTITSSLGDVVVKATKVIKNTMSFPILISYFQYVIKLIDFDGVDTGSCAGVNSGLTSNINPCFFGFCYEPYSQPTAVAPLIVSGDLANLKPGNSIITGKRLLMPGETGPTGLELNVNVQTASRLADEMMTKEMMCGDIENGLIVIGLQADPNCADANKAEADLLCTFPLRVYFNLKTYAMGGTDTCGAQMDVPSYLPFTFYSDGLYQFTDAWPDGLKLNPGLNVEVLLVDDWEQTMTRSDPRRLSLLDSFEISFDLRISDHCAAGAGEALALHFMVDAPFTSTSPQIVTNCDSTCDDRYASKDLAVSNEYASLVFAFYQCNSIAWIVNGNIAAPYRKSQSCAGEPLDNGNWGTATFTYNAHDKRGAVKYFQSGFPQRSFDFDLDLSKQLGGRDFAYVALSANTGGWTCSAVRFRNMGIKGPRTNGLQTTLHSPLVLPVAGQVSSLVFRARDENKRKRGRGGNTWEVQILDAATGLEANHNTGLTPRVVDNQDGTYTLRYQIYTRGRYRIRVACFPGVAPDICNSPNVFVSVTEGLFVRAAEA